MLPFELTNFPGSYGVSLMSTSTEIDRVIKGFYCIWVNHEGAAVLLPGFAIS